MSKDNLLEPTNTIHSWKASLEEGRCRKPENKFLQLPYDDLGSLRTTVKSMVWKPFTSLPYFITSAVGYNTFIQIYLLSISWTYT